MLFILNRIFIFGVKGLKALTFLVYIKFNSEEVKNFKVFLKFINGLLFSLPTRKNLRYNWNFGSILGIILVFQIVTGTLLVFYYSNDSLVSFDRIQYIIYNTSIFSYIRILHFNGVSLFFLFLYSHIFKGLMFFRYRLKHVWASGLTIFLLIIGEGFMGYAIVWAQMSYWACVVITSLIMVVPIFGDVLVGWVWNSFNIWNATLKVLFVVHFLLPYVILIVVCFHLIFLHFSGSTSVLYLLRSTGKQVFYKVYWLKDSLNLVIWFVFFVYSFLLPFLVGDPEMFIDVDPNISPAHIVPEWYFLFAYAILRAIPNKFLGVVCLLLSIVVMYFFIFVSNYVCLPNKFNKFLVFYFILFGVLLSWLGQCFVEVPYPFLRAVYSVLYFFIVGVILFIYKYFKLLFI